MMNQFRFSDFFKVIFTISQVGNLIITFLSASQENPLSSRVWVIKFTKTDTGSGGNPDIGPDMIVYDLKPGRVSWEAAAGGELPGAAAMTS